MIGTTIRGCLLALLALAPSVRAASGGEERGAQEAAAPILRARTPHAPLHPGDANLFLELSDAQAALAAMGDSPWRRFLGSAGMQKLFELATSVGVDPRLAASDVLPKGAFEEGSPLRTLVRASFSLSGIDRLRAGSTIAAESSGGGSVPAQTRAGSSLAAESIGWQAVLDFPDAEKTNAARELFAHWAPWRPDPRAAQGTIALGSRELSYTRFVDSFGQAQADALATGSDGKHESQLPFSWLLADDARLVLGSGSNTPEHYAERVRGTSGLPNEEQLFHWGEPFAPSSGVRVLDLYSALDAHALAGDSSRAQRLELDFLLPTLFPFVGARGIWRYEMHDRRFVTESAFTPYANSGLYDKRALEPRGAAYVPKEALGAWVPHLDPRGLERTLRALIAPTEATSTTPAATPPQAGTDPNHELAPGSDHEQGGTPKHERPASSNHDQLGGANRDTTSSGNRETPGSGNHDAARSGNRDTGGSGNHETPGGADRDTLGGATHDAAGSANSDRPGSQDSDLPGFAEALGSASAAYLLPLTNIQSPLPRIAIVVEVKDAAKLERALDAWGEALVKERKDVRWIKKSYRKHPLWELASGDPDKKDDESKNGRSMTPDLSPQPTLALLDDRLILALKLSVAQAEVRRIVDGKPFEAHAIGAGGHFPSDAFEASVMDWSAYLGKFVDLLKGLAPMLAQMGSTSFDASGLPDGALLAEHFKPTWSWSKELADGRTFTHSESSFGPDTPAAIGAFVLGLISSQSGEALRGMLPGGLGAFGADRSASADAPPNAANSKLPGSKLPDSKLPGKTPDAKPQDKPQDAKPQNEARDNPASASGKSGTSTSKNTADADRPSAEDPQTITLHVLRELKTGIAVYRSQNGRVPARLEQLLEPTDAFPKGFLSSSEVPRDAWKHAFVYSAEPDGKKYKLRSLGPDGIDQQGGGDDVLAP